MAKSTITFSVAADTKQARQQLSELKTQIDKTQRAASTKGGGMGGRGSAGGGMGGRGGLLGGFSGVARAAGGAAVALAGIAKAAEMAWNGINSFAKAGREAQQQYDRLSTVLGTMQRNLTGNGDAGGLVDFLQRTAANGANSVDDLANAAQKLMAAFGGDQGKVRELLPLFDDLAIGTGKSVAEWATLQARIEEAGVTTRTLNQLVNSGIPIYKALASTMGTTESEVKALAAAGQISTQQWTDAVKELHKSYKGLSAELSNKTLQGAKDTMEANKALANRAAAAAQDAPMRDYYTKQGQLWADRNDSLTYQALSTAAGETAGNLNALSAELKDMLSPVELTTRALGGLLDAVGVLDRYKGIVRGNAQAALIDANTAGLKLGDDATAAQISTALQGIKDALDRWQKMSGKSEAELSKDPAFIRAQRQIERLEQMQGAATARETQQRVDEYGQTLIKRTLADVLASKGYKNYDAYTRAADAAKDRLTSGKGSVADMEFMREYERINKEHEAELRQIAAEEEQARRDALAREDTRMKYADADTMKDLVTKYMGYDASVGNIGARRDEIRAGLADGSLEPSPDLMRELSVIETYLAKINDEAEKAANSPEAKEARKEAEAAEARKRRDAQTEAEVDTTRQKGRAWLKNNHGTAEASQLDREARSLTQLQRTRFNKSRAARDSQYEEDWKTAQELKKLGITDVNAMREWQAGEKAQEAEREKIQRMDTIISKLDSFAPTYQ